MDIRWDMTEDDIEAAKELAERLDKSAYLSSLMAWALPAVSLFFFAGTGFNLWILHGAILEFEDILGPVKSLSERDAIFIVGYLRCEYALVAMACMASLAGLFFMGLAIVNRKQARRERLFASLVRSHLTLLAERDGGDGDVSEEQTE